MRLRILLLLQGRTFFDKKEREREREGERGRESFTQTLAASRFQPAVVSVRPSAQKSRPPPTSPPAEPGKRRRNRLEKVTDPIFKGGYDRGRGGGLGLFTLLLRFKYKHIPKRVQIELDKLLHKSVENYNRIHFFPRII